MSKQFRACVIGCTSRWYQRIHHPALQRLADKVNLVAAASRDAERRKAITSQMGFDRAYADIDDMLDKEKPDYAVVCVAPSSVAELACKVLERGVPLFTEKPVGETVEDGRRVLAAAERAGVPNMVAFNRRFNPLLLRAKTLIEERGDVSQYVCEFLRHDVRAPSRRMGSSLHAIDALRFLAGEVASFSGAGSSVQYFDEKMVAASFHLSFETGAVGSFTFNVRVGRAYERYRVSGENWMATVSLGPPGTFDDRWWMTLEVGNREVERIHLPSLDPARQCTGYTNGFWGEHEHFVECLATGRQPSPDVASAVRSMELAREMFVAVAPPEQVKE